VNQCPWTTVNKRYMHFVALYECLSVAYHNSHEDWHRL